LSDTNEPTRAIASLLEEEALNGPNFQVELRESFAPPTASRPVTIAILWQAERPLAVLARQRLTLARTAPATVRGPLVALARERGVRVAYTREFRLWSLMAPPPPGLRALEGGSLPV